VSRPAELPLRVTFTIGELYQLVLVDRYGPELVLTTKDEHCQDRRWQKGHLGHQDSQIHPFPTKKGGPVVD
jgi:hypothetical protein